MIEEKDPHFYLVGIRTCAPTKASRWEVAAQTGSGCFFFDLVFVIILAGSYLLHDG